MLFIASHVSTVRSIRCWSAVAVAGPGGDFDCTGLNIGALKAKGHPLRDIRDKEIAYVVNPLDFPVIRNPKSLREEAGDGDDVHSASRGHFGNQFGMATDFAGRHVDHGSDPVILHALLHG